MMHNLAPTAIRLIDFYDDGEHARHFRFQLFNTDPGATAVHHDWMQAKTGQFFMLCLPAVGEAPFTFTQVPDQQGYFRALVRKMGQVTSALFQLEPGQILGARGPYGEGWPMDQVINKSILVVGGGCGLAPLVGVVNQLVAQKNYAQLMVVYGARSRQARMLTPERRQWQQAIPVFNAIEDGDLEPGQNEFSGTPVDLLPMVLGQFQQGPDVVLLAGPQAMMFAAAKHLVTSGVSEQGIYLSIERRMHCGVRTCGHCYLKDKYICSDGPTFRWDVLQAYIPQSP
ncbi:FAD/NAD(P)-binding protein [Photobacterium sp. 53610]|uniref:FAD/NAD(P)-binding protein n=1 Tax=Photobacterium sp. 53610 TaxID=3102789 RepID=UPI002EDA9AF7